MGYDNKDALKTDCVFFNESFTDKHKPCKEICPLNKDRVCNRWDICFKKEGNKGENIR